MQFIGESTLLHLAAERSLIEHIEVLLEFGVDVNIKPMVSASGCCDLSASHIKWNDYLSPHLLDIRTMILHCIMHVDMVRL